MAKRYNNSMSVKIFTMTHKSFDLPPDDTYIPMQVGAEGKEDLGYLKDNIGDNISSLNPFFAELSGMYWVWKNVVQYDYVGICHYRRYPVNADNMGMSATEYEAVLSSCDLITSKLIELPNPYYVGYKANHNIRDLELIGKVLGELYPDYKKCFEDTVHDRYTYFGNIIVAPKALFDEYCAWLFPIFFRVHEMIGKELEEYDDYHKRMYGFVSEILLYVWVKVRGLKAYECKIGMLGEKKETIELKQKLSEYFMKHDYKGAQKYFETVLKVRPDVMMEASDVTGELKLCMQIIATCNYECSASDNPRFVLEYIDDYRRLMELFSSINKNVVHLMKNEEIEDAKAVILCVDDFARYAKSRGYDYIKDYNGYMPSASALYVSYKMNENLYTKHSED